MDNMGKKATVASLLQLLIAINLYTVTRSLAAVALLTVFAAAGWLALLVYLETHEFLKRRWNIK